MVIEGAILHDQRRHGRVALLLQHQVVAEAQPDLRDEPHLREVQELRLGDRVARRGEALGVRLGEPDPLLVDGADAATDQVRLDPLPPSIRPSACASRVRLTQNATPTRRMARAWA